MTNFNPKGANLGYRNGFRTEHDASRCEHQWSTTTRLLNQTDANRLRTLREQRVPGRNLFPDEIDVEEEQSLPEGAAFKRLVNAYERNPLARQQCIKKYGPTCFVCGFSFGATYGAAMDGFIHVHHLRPLSEVGKEYKDQPYR